MMKNHYQVIQKVIDRETSDLGDKVNKMNKEISRIKSDLNTKTNELNAIKNAKDPNKDIITGIYQSVSEGSKEKPQIAEVVEVGPGTTLTGFLKKINRKVTAYHVETPEDLEKIAASLAE